MAEDPAIIRAELQVDHEKTRVALYDDQLKRYTLARRQGWAQLISDNTEVVQECLKVLGDLVPPRKESKETRKRESSFGPAT